MALGTIGALIAGTIGASVVGGLAANKAANTQANAAQAAADAQVRAARMANRTQRYIFDKSVELTEPQREIGNNALAGMASLQGLGAAPEGFTGFQADPGYQFRLDQGNQAMERAMAARGIRLSGAGIKAAGEYNQGMASQEYGNWYNRLAGLAGVGQTATGQQLGAGQNYANQTGQNFLNMGNAQGQGFINAGNARASGYMGMNDAFQGGMNNMFNIFGMQQAGMFK